MILTNFFNILIFFLLIANAEECLSKGHDSKIIAKNDPYLEDLVNNLNFLVNSTSPPLEINSRMSEPPTLLKTASIADSKRYARFAGAAYCDDSTIQKWSCYHCRNITNRISFVNVYFDKATEARAYLALDHWRREVILSFRGSSTLRNFIQDAKIKKDLMALKGEKHYVHRGFKQCAEALFPKYITDLRTILGINSSFRLVVTGHSLGGAISIISTFMIQDRIKLNDEKISVFTYGEPRVGDQDFARFVNRQSFSLTRVVNGNDVVPHLPPQIKFVSNYYHHQNEIWVYKGIDHTCNDEYLEDPNCSASQWYKPSVNDHLSVWGIRLGGKC